MVVIMFILNTMPYGAVANELSIIKYGYGIREWDGKQYLEPSRHPKQWYQDREVNARFTIAEDMDLKVQHLYKISLSLKIEKHFDDIMAILEFHNLSNNSYYIRRSSLPYEVENNDFSEPSDTGEMCRMLFFISSDDISLDYLGGICDIRSTMDRNDWYEFLQKEKLTFRLILNDNYKFMVGEHFYNIKSSYFTLVTKEWFIESKINEEMFFLMDANKWSYEKSALNNFLLNNESSCGSEDFYCFMKRFNFDGTNSDYEFKISSNQVRVNLNGDKIKSFYEK